MGVAPRCLFCAGVTAMPRQHAVSQPAGDASWHGEKLDNRRPIVPGAAERRLASR